MKLPTSQQCLDLFEEYKVPKNIFAHCKKVQEVAVFLAQELNKAGENIDIELVSKIAILHDLFKAAALPELKPSKYHPYNHTAEEIAAIKKLKEKYPQKYENEIAYEELKDKYPEFALAVKHAGDPYYDQKSPEEMLVHYVDIRVLKENIVTLPERFLYLKEVYRKDEKYWASVNTKITGHEKRIFSKLSYSPEQLKQKFEAQHGR